MPRCTTRLMVLAIAILAGCGGGESTGPDRTPASVTITPGAAQSLASGTTATLTASVANARGDPVTGASVSWSSSDATIASVSGGVVTAAKVGVANITATAGTVTSQAVQVTVTPGSATTLAIRTQPGGAVSGQTLTTQPVIEVRDAAGNLVSSSAAIVTAGGTASGTSISGTTAITAAAGVATYTDLMLVGHGSTTLTFTAPGLAGATSSAVDVQPPPDIVLSATTEAFAATAGSSTHMTKTVAVTNGGGSTLSGLATGVTYPAGEQSGWITATLSSATAPSTLRITVDPTGLAAGDHSATVSITSAIADNSPRQVTVTLSLALGPASLQFGADDAKVLQLDAGASVTPALVALDAQGQPTSMSTVLIASRAPSVASVDAAGKITGVGPGSGWVAAVSGGIGDSVWTIVPAATGPVLRTSLSRVWWNPGDTVVADLILDTRGTTVGAATVLLTWSADYWTGVFVYLDEQPSAGSPVSPVVTVNPITGVIRLTMASATGVSGSIGLARLRFIARTDLGPNGRAGFMYATPQEVLATDGSSLTTSTTATQYPLIVR